MDHAAFLPFFLLCAPLVLAIVDRMTMGGHTSGSRTAR